MKKLISWMTAICVCLIFVLLAGTNTYAAEYSIATNDSWVNGSAGAGEANYYTFTLPSAGLIKVTCQATTSSVECFLYNEDLTSSYGLCSQSGSEANPGTNYFYRNLVAGTYKLKLCKNWGAISYRVKVSFLPANNSEAEPNNTFDTAMPLSSGQQIKGLIAENDTLDFYKFTIASPTTVKITLNRDLDNALSSYRFSVWNSDLIQESADDRNTSGNTDVWEKSLASGTYYIKINGHWLQEYTGTYILKWEGFNYVTFINLRKTSMTLAKGKTYSLLESVLPSTATNKQLNWISDNKSVVTVDSAGKVTAKNVGAATITAAAQDGSKVSASCQVVVKPAKTVIKSCKRAKDRNVIVKVQKQNNISGIQYQLSKKKNFKGKTSSYYAGATETTATTAKLSKNKTYYFRARMYIDYGGKRYYGDWSTVKKIKTKAKSYKYGYYAWKSI